MNYHEIHLVILNSWYTLVLLVVSEMLRMLFLLILGGDISCAVGIKQPTDFL